jgi:hypothetical protein
LIAPVRCGGAWKCLSYARVRSLESGGQLCVRVFGWNLALVALKIFLHSVCFLNIFDKFSTFSAICKDNVALNITVHRTQESFPSNSTGLTMPETLIKLSIVVSSNKHFQG